jgi:hypothetical protein
MTFLLLFAVLFVLPVAAATALHFTGDRIVDWRNADKSSAGLLPPAIPQTPAVVRIFSARTVRWRGIVATHSWIVIKDAGATSYSRFDYTAWGEPIWVDRFHPRWPLVWTHAGAGFRSRRTGCRNHDPADPGGYP